MKKILWVSRHTMTESQKADLDRIMGDEVQLLPWRDTVQDINQLLPLLRQADGAAVVLPTELLAKLVKAAGKKPILQAVSARKPTGRMLQLSNGQTEPEFTFVHRGWQQILRLDLITRML